MSLLFPDALPEYRKTTITYRQTLPFRLNRNGNSIILKSTISFNVSHDSSKTTAGMKIETKLRSARWPAFGMWVEAGMRVESGRQIRTIRIEECHSNDWFYCSCFGNGSSWFFSLFDFNTISYYTLWVLLEWRTSIQLMNIMHRLIHSMINSYIIVAHMSFLFFFYFYQTWTFTVAILLMWSSSSL